MRYGDTLRLCLGSEKERFEAGAFGTDVATRICHLDIQHMRDQKIARTGGAGLTLTDSAYRPLNLRAELDVEDPLMPTCVTQSKEGNHTRGLSIEFMPLKDRLEGSQVRADIRLL